MLEIVPLANSQAVTPDPLPQIPDAMSLILPNSSLPPDGWCLIGPFGEWPQTRQYVAQGRLHEEHYLQVLDNEAANQMVAEFNCWWGQVKRFVSAVPVLRGHGDLAEVDPQAVAHDPKLKLGTVDQLRVSERGLEAHIALDADGEAALAAGCKYPSALWWVKRMAGEGKSGQRASGQAETTTPPGSPLPSARSPLGHSHRCRPFKLISVALTAHPNISGVESLANSRLENVPCEANQNKETPMKLIAGWMLAQGLALANPESPTETQLLEGLQRLHTTNTASLTALGNEKSTLATTLLTLTTERDDWKRQSEHAATALANEQAGRAAERRGRAAAVTDLAIHQGKLTPAQREQQITALANSPDFDTAAQAILAAAPVVKIAGHDVQSGRQQAATTEQQALANEYQAALQTELIHAGQDPVKAHQNIMRLPKYAALAEKLAPKKF